MSERLIVFARRPDPGRAKTRLIAVLGEAATHALYRALLLDSIAFAARLARSGRAVEISFDAPWDPDRPFRDACAGLELTVQAGGDLGDRLLHALRRAAERGSTSTVFLGADAPTLAEQAVEDAFAALAGGADAVVGPSNDGGYVLVGARRPMTGLFRDIPWGTGGVLGTTRLRARESGIRLVEVEGGIDVDEPADLDLLRSLLRDPGIRRRAPRTASWLDVHPRAG